MAHQQSSENGARELLRSIISEKEWAQFKETGTLEISGKAGIYRVRMHGATQILDSQTRRLVTTTRWESKAHSSRDRVISEYLLIRNDENLYWQAANICVDSSGARLYYALLLTAFNAILLMVLFAQLR